MNDRYLVESVGFVYNKGKKVEAPVIVAYNKELDNVFGRGYAAKCARIHAKDVKGQIKLSEKGRVIPVEL